ncbi:MAG: universal stress protein [Woeseiaceae bacterium]|nr:universal stress protein [Woeseiaceae bacterium]
MRRTAGKLESWLGEKAAQLRSKDIRVETELTWHSPRYEAIIDKANKVNASLIIRSARHHSKLERLLVSATDWGKLIRHAPQTVWLVKKRPAADRTGLNVLAAVDPVHAEEKKLGLDQRILAAASSIADMDGGKLHLFHAWQPGAAIAPAIAAGPHVPMPIVRVDDATLKNMREQRKQLLRELSESFGVPAERVHLQEGAVTSVLDEVVHEHDIDVVVAGGMSRGRLERLVIGSTAEAILESVDCDVVVVKPEKRGK